MTSRERKILSVVLATDQPTPLHFADVYTWVIWQFPNFNGAWLCGAVRPPLAGQSWLPALIDPEDQKLLVYAHLTDTFTTPEAAAEHCQFGPPANSLGK